MQKSIERMEAQAYRLGEQEDQVLELIGRLREETDSTSFRMNVFLLSFMCEYVAQHSEYRAAAERRHQLFNTRETLSKLLHIQASEKNFKFVLQFRIDLVLACLNNEPHYNRYSGEHV